MQWWNHKLVSTYLMYLILTYLDPVFDFSLKILDIHDTTHETLVQSRSCNNTLVDTE